MSEEDFLSFVENMNFKGKYFCVFNQDDIYDDGSETLALEQEILAEYLYFFEVDDDSLDKYEMLKYRQIGKKFCVLDKEQFLRYEDDCYFKKTPDFLEMRSFLRNETGLSKAKFHRTRFHSLARTINGRRTSRSVRISVSRWK